jgi:hypothetical protein
MIKKLLLTILTFCLFASGNCYAGGGKWNSTSIHKESKKVYKELKNGGWKVYGNNLPLEAAVNQYYHKLDEANGSLYALTGEATANHENLALRKAQYQATAQYAAQQETQVSRVVNIQVSNEISDEVKSQSEFDNTVQASVDQNIKSLRPELTLIRKKGDGQVEVKLLFLIRQD